MTKIYGALLGLAFALTLSGGASAQTISYGQAMNVLVGACGQDIEKNCKGIKPGGNRVSACLEKNQSKISQNCQQTYAAAFADLAKRNAAQQAAPDICAPDIKRLCQNFNQGRARILRCLTRVDNRRKVSNKCNQAITDAGWR